LFVGNFLLHGLVFYQYDYCQPMYKLKMTQKNYITLAGVIGLIAAFFTGLGEFLLHFDSLGRYAGGYEFMVNISDRRSTIGHYSAVLSAPLYLVGMWHIMKMLEPANANASKVGFAIMVYGFVEGILWIGSRASISAIVNDAGISDISNLVNLYELRYENLLQITRLAVLALSIIFTWLVLTGRSHYPKWVSVFNPILLILACFALWIIVPTVGNFIMPIALNVSFGILFIISIYYSTKINE